MKKITTRPFQTAREEVQKVLKKPTAYNYAVAFTDQEFLLREELRPVRLQLELLRPELVLHDHGITKTIVFFGSARLPTYKIANKELLQAKAALEKDPQDPKLQQAVKKAANILENSAYLKEAEQLAYLASTDKTTHLVVVTGGGPSFMEAANKGAYMAKAKSVTLNVLLPDEQEPNPYVTPELTFQFHYFAIRKMHFLMRARALAAFPGGYGTMDEIFEVLTLLQTRKIKRVPLLLFNEKFWRRIINFEALVDEGTISEEDLQLFNYVETAEQAWEIICDFYK